MTKDITLRHQHVLSTSENEKTEFGKGFARRFFRLLPGLPWRVYSSLLLFKATLATANTDIIPTIGTTMSVNSGMADMV